MQPSPPHVALEEEIRRLEELRARNPRGHTFARLADLYRMSGLLEKGLEVVEQGLLHHPHYLNAHLIHGGILRDLGRGAEAEMAFRRVLDIDAENSVARRALTALEGGPVDATRSPNEAARREATPSADGVGLSTDGVPPSGTAPGTPPVPTADSPGHGSSQASAEPTGWLAQLEAEWRRKREPARPSDGEVARGPEPTEGARDRTTPHDVARDPNPPDATPEVATATLAELYLRQGLYEEAISVYEKLLARDPYSARLAASLDEARRLSREGRRRGAAPASATPVSGREFPRPGPIPSHAQAREAADRTIRQQLTSILEGCAPVNPSLESGALRRLSRWLREAVPPDGD